MGEVKLWSVPIQVEVQLFTRPEFVQSTMQTLMLFRPEFPLVYARIKQLRGDLTGAIREYVSFRLAENVPSVIDKKKTIPKEIQEGLNVYATLYLGLAHLERNDLANAEPMFSRLVAMLPEPGPNRPILNMFRWVQIPTWVASTRPGARSSEPSPITARMIRPCSIMATSCGLASSSGRTPWG